MKGHDANPLEEGSGDDELWLISYADLLTLLIAFFVLMISASPMRAPQFERLVSSLSGGAPAPLTALRSRVDALIAKEKLGDRARTTEDAEGLGIELKDVLFFDSGSAELRAEARTLIAGVAALLRDLPDRGVIVEGHTDDVPIHTAMFPSNWELSAQRAINVRSALEAHGIPHRQTSIRSYADNRAASAEGPISARRAASRRVVIRVE